MPGTYGQNAHIDWRSLEELAARSGRAAEHISLGEDDALDAVSEDRRTISRRFELDNRARGARTLLELYENHVLRISEQRGQVAQRAYCVDLRDVEARMLTWRRRTAAGWIAVCSIAMSVCFAAFGYFAVLPGLTVPLAIALVIVSAIAARAYVNRYEERIGVRTRHGKALIHLFSSNFGCVRKGRKLARGLRNAIRRAQQTDGRDENDQLRSEIRAHYCLAEAGAISQRACTAAVRKALACFR